MTHTWNVVVTTRPDEYSRAQQLLQRFGEVEPTDYYNVLLFSATEPRQFLEALTERAHLDPRLGRCIGRVAPLTHMFEFSSGQEFEARAREVVQSCVPQLEGKSFHVRITRRGFKHEISSQAEEQFLDHVLLEELERRGAPGRITFDDPDAILELETVDGRAGISLWTRDDLRRYPFLNVD